MATTTVDAPLPPVEQSPATNPVPDPADESKPAAGKKELKAKKKSPSPRNPKSHSHPSYIQMISDAILSLKERTGSSQYAISKFIIDKHKSNLPSNFKKHLLVQLKKLVASGKLKKIKGSFKLAKSSSSAAAAVNPNPNPKPKSKSKPAAAAASVESEPAAKLKTKAKAKAKAKTVAKPKAASAEKTVKTNRKAAVKPKGSPAKPKGSPAKPKPKPKPKSVNKKKPVARTSPVKKGSK